MKYSFITLPAMLMAFLNFAMAQSTADSVNLALSATVSTSYVSPWETLQAVKDGYTPASSSDYTHGAYGNWDGEANYNKFNWVEYRWNRAHDISSTSIYWWDDGQGIDQPTEAYLEYWNGLEWIDAGTIGTDLDKYNSVKLTARASALRVNMKSAMATGIIEWRVFGIESEPCDPTTLTPTLQVGEGPIETTSMVTITAGDSLRLIPEPGAEGLWNWTGPSSYSSSERIATVRDISLSGAGIYTVTLINECGALSTTSFTVSVIPQGSPGQAYRWTPYDPVIDYDFRDEFPDLTEPQDVLDDCAGVVGTTSSGWWTFRWGANANPLVTEDAIAPMLERMNNDFAYFRNEMGWPPDKRAKRGYKSAIYLYGSGLCTDNASNTDLGGWMGSIFHDGENWPMVLISYYPVYCFDPSCNYGDKGYQSGAVVHEGIHAILADLPGCRQAGWFHEGGNTWLQQEATARQTGNYSSMGFLNGASFIAPFMPIECYSGWLQDGSFGGPSAEGVNKFTDGTQVCTWRNLLGGVQYSNIFPTFLGMTLGQGSIPWIWRYAETRVLEGIASGMGETQVRKLIMEYRAKQALIDMGNWTGAIKTLMDSQFGIPIGAEWQPSWLNPQVWYATPYVNTTDDGSGLLTPESRTLPGWSGANQVPLVVNGPTVTIDFQPLSPNMSCQLCYRTRDGETVYSTPVFGGRCSLDIEKEPANNVVFAVITNTDYIYKGEETRKAHFDYRLQLVEGVSGTANINRQWYDWTKVISTSDAIWDLSAGPEVTVFPNPVEAGQGISIKFGEPAISPVDVRVLTLNGRVVWRGEISGETVTIPCNLGNPGTYLLIFEDSSGRSYRKLVAR